MQTSRSPRTRPRLWMLGLAAATLATPDATAQRCALDVDIEKKSEVAYKERGNRCEGVYDQDVANRIDLRIAGYHLDAPVFDPRADDAVELTVASHRPDRRVILRVVSTRPRDYFQMDTSAIADDGTFSWPMDVVRLLDEPIRPYDTAAVACAAGCDGGRSNQATLLPVRFSVPKAGQAPFVLAVADVELSQLTATLRQGDQVIYENLAVGGPYLPPHKTIRVPVKGADPGEAVLSLSALTGRKQRDFLEAVLIVPGRHE